MSPEPATVALQPHHSPVDIHAALDDVRQIKEFAPAEPGWLERLSEQPLVKAWIEQAQAALQHALENLRAFLSQTLPAGSELPPYVLDVASTAAGLLLMILGVVAFYLMLGSLRRMLPRRKPQTASQPRSFEGILLRDAAYHRQAAQHFSQSGQLDAAIRELYLCLLCLLEERGILSFEPTRSNAEYRELLAERDTLARLFSHVSQAFEASHYGGIPVQPQSYQDCEQALHCYSEANPHG